MSDIVTPPTRRPMRVFWKLFWFGVILLVLVCTGLIQFVWILTTGWISFLLRTGRETTIRYDSLAWFAPCLLLLTFLLHYTFNWVLNHPVSSESSEAIAQPPHEWPFRRTCVLSLAALCSLIAGICLVGISHEIIWITTSKNPIIEMVSGHRAARRTQSKNNLKQLGLVFHNWHDANHSYPASMTFDEHGRIRHGWEAAILPQIDQLALYERIRFDLAWNAPENRVPFERRLMAFLNPAVNYHYGEDGYALIHYAGNSHVLQSGRKMRLRDFSDGSSNTVFAGEINADFPPWGKPGNCRDPGMGINKSPQGFGSPFKGGAQFLMADGTVRFISENVDPQTLKALATPNGGEPVGDF